MNKNLFVDTEAVAFFMKKRNMTTENFAQKIGLNVKTVENYLKGASQKNASGTLPWRMAHALNVPVKVILLKFYEEQE